jgi:DnaJ-class molecular chaperone
VAKDYYAILGVPRNANAEQIKRAYRKLARELHPDVNPDAQAQQRFQDVTAAYEVLTDPQKRQIVDLGGDPLEPGRGAGGGDPFGGFGFGDIMDAFFGATGGPGRRGPDPAAAHPRGVRQRCLARTYRGHCSAVRRMQRCRLRARYRAADLRHL